VRIDHLRAIQSSSYRASLSRRIARIAPGRLHVIAVVHEDDGSCCAREPWPLACSKIFAPAIARVGGGNAKDVASLLAEHEPGIIIASRKEREDA
jgi:hypothetical protein